MHLLFIQVHPVEEYQNITLTRERVDRVQFKKKVGVELLYNSVHRKFNKLGSDELGDKLR